MRCAALLAELADDGLPVDRAGNGVVVEVYPAASMRRWDITSAGYKASNGKSAALAAAAESLKLNAAWLNLGEYETSAGSPMMRSTRSSRLSPLVPRPWIWRASRTPRSSGPRGSKAG
jgi:hypothetical protein